MGTHNRMKNLEDREKFIQLRAEGKSYRQIQEVLGIALATCSSWEAEYKDKINELKGDRMQELYNSYYMTKEARIQKLGDTLNKINDALEGADLSTVAPEKLLDYKLKYVEALKGEYIDTTHKALEGDFTAKDILNSIGDLLTRLKTGAVTPEQASRESAIFSNLLKAYENVELADKIKVLEGIIGSK